MALWDQYNLIYALSPQSTFLILYAGLGWGHSGDTPDSRMAQADVTFQPDQTPDRCSVGFSRSTRLVPGFDLPFCLTFFGFNGMAVKAQVLRYRGIYESEIPTILQF